MTNVFIDIETIPGQGMYDEFLEDARNNFKAPSTLTKAQAADDLGMTDSKEIKFTSKDDMISKWERVMASTKADQVADESWRKTSFDGAKGEIISIAWAVGSGEIWSLQRELNGEVTEEILLEQFFQCIVNQCDGRPPYFIGQYIGGFDLKFIFQRAVILGVKPPFGLPFNGRHPQDYYCTQQAWAGFKGRMSQDNLCKALDIEGKPDDIDGSKVWDFVKAGKVERVAEYNRDDVEKVRKIYNRLNFIGE